MSGNPIFDAAFALELATIKPEAPAPAGATGALGYGSDLSCVNDCTPDYAEVDPLTKRALAEALIRRLTTPRGSVIDDANYGTDIRQGLSVGVTLAGMQSYSDQIIGEVAKDDRVVAGSPTCTLSYDRQTSTLRFALTVEAVDLRIGVFTLTFTVTEDGAVLIESIV